MMDINSDEKKKQALNMKILSFLKNNNFSNLASYYEQLQEYELPCPFCGNKKELPKRLKNIPKDMEGLLDHILNPRNGYKFKGSTYGILKDFLKEIREQK